MKYALSFLLFYGRSWGQYCKLLYFLVFRYPADTSTPQDVKVSQTEEFVHYSADFCELSHSRSRHNYSGAAPPS